MRYGDYCYLASLKEAKIGALASLVWDMDFVEYVLIANQLTVVTKEVLETARKNLIIGPD